jgi:hypothetical protein
MHKLRRSKKDLNLLKESLQEWQDKGYLSEEKRQELEGSMEANTFNWQDISSSAFVIAVSCMLIAVLGLFADQWLLNTLDQLIEASDLIKSLGLALLAIFMYWCGWKKQQKQASNYSRETFYSLGVLATGMSLGFAGFAIESSERLFPYLMAMAAAIYLLLAIPLRSQLLWVFGLIALGACFGTATAYHAEWQAYYRGMNYPLRFILFGGLLTLTSLVLPLNPLTKPFFKVTQTSGIFCLLFCLWLMSIFGNMGDYDLWEQVSQSRFLGWSVLLLASSLLAAWWGKRQNKLIIRDLGIAFMLLNFYTRYTEFCWSLLPKPLFFALIALSFWLIGKQAEKAWKSLKHPVS